MKIKMICISLLILILFLLLGYCRNQKENIRERYDSSINQVIILENKRLQKEKKLDDNEILKREDTGIVVYSDGKYIELIYELDSNKQNKSLYKYNEKNNSYEQFPHTPNKLKKIQKYLEKTSYIENIGLK
ncbi:cystatin-like fold lipoprotein [Geobacillus stearothermophilus]|jgi:Domain of unknown function with cystatin-like fold (DUF4467)|uniref:cystatin-like fold lipoprotein n=2 Tax=Geobacillus stearothermophilus TaxID=1422 RepID=UPI00067A779C|nr:cystatin-like fold lipoprotein [Geobacillus stearothermophilus]MED4333110.1 cystatin-like fold lipoprotein [Geobacillus stearothermophilus]MED4995081.1 cystatin-like fold lipoprotein [Geobacillus stearothermophilus]